MLASVSIILTALADGQASSLLRQSLRTWVRLGYMYHGGYLARQHQLRHLYTLLGSTMPVMRPRHSSTHISRTSHILEAHSIRFSVDMALRMALRVTAKGRAPPTWKNRCWRDWLVVEKALGRLKQIHSHCVTLVGVLEHVQNPASTPSLPLVVTRLGPSTVRPQSYNSSGHCSDAWTPFASSPKQKWTLWKT